MKFIKTKITKWKSHFWKKTKAYTEKKLHEQNAFIIQLYILCANFRQIDSQFLFYLRDPLIL